MKRRIALLLALTLLVGLLAGCVKQEAKNPVRRFTAANEIVTYEKIDDQKTQLVVSRTGNIAVEAFCEAFEAENPDIQIVYLDITGGNTEYSPVRDWITGGYLPDVMFSAGALISGEDVDKYFVNLSADPIIDNYEAAALKRTAVNANIYWLPGPSNINCLLYNKTLFSKYGWEVPATFDEFVKLCVQIKADTNGEVEPWNPNAKYSNELTIALESFVYEELFGGVENRTWYEGFISGKRTFTEHMKPYYDAIQTLVDNGILRPDHFTYSATTRLNEFKAGKIAMVNMVAADYDNDAFDFGFMPFPTTKGTIGYICDTFSCIVGVPKQERDAKTQAALERFLAYFSSAKGQEVYIAKSMQISNVKDVALNQSDDLAALESAVQAGHMFELLDFHGPLGARAFSVHQNAGDMASGTMTGAECLAKVDENPYSPVSETTEQKPEAVATAPKDMTILETSFYLADAYRAYTGADIGLIGNGIAYRGNVMRIFAGDVTAGVISVLKPRSFANKSTLVKASMTGKQLLDALNAPLDYDDKPADALYAYSGLKCELAPWKPMGEKYVSVKLADSSALQMDKLYTVAFWAGTVPDACVTEVVETYEDAFETILTAKMQADKTVTATNDGRYKLSWK